MQDEWEAVRQNSETIGFRPELKHLLQQRLLRWTAPLQSPARTDTDGHAARLATVLARTVCAASIAPTSVCLSSSAPSKSKVLRRPVESAQYCAHDYRKILRGHGFKVSTSGKGNC